MEKLLETIQKQEVIIREILDKHIQLEERVSKLEKDFGSAEGVLLDGVNEYYKEYLDDNMKEEKQGDRNEKRKY